MECAYRLLSALLCFNEQFVGNAFLHSAWVMVLRRCVESKNVDSFRRERIYPFRPRSGITAPNYLTKGQVIRISSRIHDKSIHKSGFADGMSKPISKGVYGPFPVQRTTDVHQPFGTDKSVPYANTGKCTIQRTAQKSLPIGMHKCIPYENSVNAPYAASY